MKPNACCEIYQTKVSTTPSYESTLPHGRSRLRRGAGDGNRRHLERPHLRPIAVDELLELRMQEVRPEAVFLHLGEGLVRRPAIVGHAIDGGHHARAMPATLAVHVHRLVGRIVHDLE